MLDAGSCRDRSKFAAVLLASAVAAGCGGSPASGPTGTATTTAPTATTADPCAATTAPARQPSLILCLSGAVTGETLVPDRETTTCTPGGPGLTGTWVTLVNSGELRLELDGAGTAGVVVSVVQPQTSSSWSSLAATGRFGRVEVAGRSGTLDVTLPPRDLATGGAGTGAALRVRGVFRCPPG